MPYIVRDMLYVVCDVACGVLWFVYYMLCGVFCVLCVMCYECRVL